MDLHSDRLSSQDEFRTLAAPREQTTNVLLDPLVMQARESCGRDFVGKLRKAPADWDQPRLPYSVHPDAVARRLAAAGFGAEVVAAGYLHDHLEDLPQLWNRERMTVEFGARVTALVDWVSEQDKSLPWRVRKAAYAERLTHAPSEAVCISIADKTCNLCDSLNYMRAGYPSESFLGSSKNNSMRLHELLPLFRERGEATLVAAFEAALNEFDSLAAKLTTKKI